MSAVINGSSWRVLKAFREKPAALAVYWAYCAHMNEENVAWRGLRSLVKETGYAINAVKAAREWLVLHELLERDEDYTPRKWRKLPKEDRDKVKLQNFNEYYRVRSDIVIKGVAYPVLYVGVRTEKEEHPLEGGVSSLDTPPVSPLDTQNLIPSVSDTNKNLSASTTDAGAAPDKMTSPQTNKPKRADNPIFDLIAEKSFNTPRGTKVMAGARIAKISHWLQGTGEVAGLVPLEENATLEQVTRFYQWYAGKYKVQPPKDAGKFAEHWCEYLRGDVSQYRTERLFT